MGPKANVLTKTSDKDMIAVTTKVNKKKKLDVASNLIENAKNNVEEKSDKKNVSTKTAANAVITANIFEKSNATIETKPSVKVEAKPNEKAKESQEVNLKIIESVPEERKITDLCMK